MADWMDDIHLAIRSLADDSKQQEEGAAAGAAAAAGSEEDSSASVAGGPRVKRARSHSTASEAMEVFERVMTEPRQRNLPSSVEEFVSQLGISEEQQTKINTLIPPAAQLSYVMLSGLSQQDLEWAGLTPQQVRAWLKVLDKLL